MSNEVDLTQPGYALPFLPEPTVELLSEGVGIQPIQLQAGDIIVITAPDALPKSTVLEFAERLSAVVPNLKIVVLDRGATLNVLRPPVGVEKDV